MLKLVSDLGLFPSVLHCDAPHVWQLGFQDPASPFFEGIVELNNTINFYLILVLVGVSWVLFSGVSQFSQKNTQIPYKYANHSTVLESIWTTLPAFILVAIAFPSFRLLYLSDEVLSSSLTIKVVGHQWFWTYSLSDFMTENNESIEFDSYLIPEADLELGQLRLLEVDNRLILPVDTHIRFIVSSTDVIHDFAVPSLGIKIDATPGKLSQVQTLIQREGVFYGQCSELCGVYHGFMPIAIESVSLEKFLIWLDEQVS